MSVNKIVPPNLRLSSVAISLSIAAFAHHAGAVEFNIENSDLSVRWDNTVKYSAGWRLKDRSRALTEGSTALNQDDGDRNFGKGLISNRLDLLSEFDMSYQDFGLRVSGAGWYDTVYQENNDNNAPDRVNAYSVKPNHFTDDTRRLHGGDVELMDAFAYWSGDLGEHPTTVRAGQYAQLWGESLFFGVNGIAGGMAPIDVVKAVSVPNTQFKELVRPIQQLGGQFQLTPDVLVAAYYQFEWEETRLPGVGSYFSSSDTLGEGNERLIVGEPFPAFLGGRPDRPAAFYHGKDKKAKDSGQGGVQVRWSTGDIDWGLYAIQFHEKQAQLLVRPSATPDFASGKIGEYYWVYPEDVRAFGASFSTTIDTFNLAGEISTRWNQPLASTNAAALAPDESINNSNDPNYAVGKTLHAQVSWLGSLGPSFISQEASFVGEVAWNRVMSVTKNPSARDPNSDRDAVALRMVYEPMYRQILPGWDVGIPLGVSYANGNSSALGVGFGQDHGGDINIGVNATYLSVWKLGLTYTHYYGPENTTLDENSHFTYQQSLKDRDFISVSLSRTF